MWAQFWLFPSTWVSTHVVFSKQLAVLLVTLAIGFALRRRKKEVKEAG
jgi:hypothetical protein